MHVGEGEAPLPPHRLQVREATEVVDDTPVGAVDESDNMDSQPGNDRIFGGAGDDWLFGGGGDDLLFGDDLEDVLTTQFLTDLLMGAGSTS